MQAHYALHELVRCPEIVQAGLRVQLDEQVGEKLLLLAGQVLQGGWLRAEHDWLLPPPTDDIFQSHKIHFCKNLRLLRHATPQGGSPPLAEVLDRNRKLGLVRYILRGPWQPTEGLDRVLVTDF